MPYNGQNGRQTVDTDFVHLDVSPIHKTYFDYLCTLFATNKCNFSKEYERVKRSTQKWRLNIAFKYV